MSRQESGREPAHATGSGGESQVRTSFFLISSSVRERSPWLTVVCYLLRHTSRF